MRDEYTKIPTHPFWLDKCPVCGTTPALWRYSENPDEPSEVAVCCENGVAFGPQGGLTQSGCLLYMPPNDFYFPTIRQAVTYWNHYSSALKTQRIQNERTIS